MPNLYPHATKSLAKAVQTSADLEARRQRLYDALPGGHQPNYDFRQQAFKAQVINLLNDYKELLNAQMRREDDENRADWTMRQHQNFVRRVNAFQSKFLFEDFNAEEGVGFAQYRRTNDTQTFEYIKKLLEKNYLLLKDRLEEKPHEGQAILEDDNALIQRMFPRAQVR